MPILNPSDRLQYAGSHADTSRRQSRPKALMARSRYAIGQTHIPLKPFNFFWARR